MTRAPAYDAAKYRAILTDLDVKRAALRGLTALRADARDARDAHVQWLASGAHGGLLDAMWNRRDVTELARYPDAELQRAGIDLPTLRRAVAEHERMVDLQRRCDLASVELQPLERLTERLTRYIEGNQ